MPVTTKLFHQAALNAVSDSFLSTLASVYRPFKNIFFKQSLQAHEPRPPAFQIISLKQAENQKKAGLKAAKLK